MFDNKYPYTDFHELNLDWFLEQFKEYEAKIITQDDKIGTMEETVQQFTDFVTHYFDNLDVQQEINNKLDAMAASGELQAMLQPYFDQFVESVDSQITTQNNRIDVLSARMDTFASLTEGSTTGDAELMDIRVGYNGVTYPTAGDAVRECDALISNKIANYGLTPLFGTDMLSECIATFDNTYFYESSGTLHNASGNFKTYKFLITQYGDYFSNENIRFSVCVSSDDNTVISSTGGGGGTVRQITCTSAVTYLYISVNNSLISDLMFAYGAEPIESSYKSDLLSVNHDLHHNVYAKSYAQYIGSISSGETKTLPTNNIKKNNVYAFNGKITNFGSLLIGHGKTQYDSAYIEITSTQIIKHTNTGSDVTESWTHGITINDYISVMIHVKLRYADITIFSNGQSYNITDTPWMGDSNGNIFIESSSSDLTECSFSWSCGDIRKPTWIFGDSYTSFVNDNRWVYYLKEPGWIDNILLNAYPGEDSNSAYPAFNNLVSYYGKPNTLIWCLGMNDGNDIDSTTPANAYLTNVNRIIKICKQHNINLILATIPTTPVLYHEGINYFVRNSGYRYIDFAAAVGAQSDGTWYTGLLSSDNVHPTTAGAKALFYRAIADAPEITYK